MSLGMPIDRLSLCFEIPCMIAIMRTLSNANEIVHRMQFNSESARVYYCWHLSNGLQVYKRRWHTHGPYIPRTCCGHDQWDKSSLLHFVNSFSTISFLVHNFCTRTLDSIDAMKKLGNKRPLCQRMLLAEHTRSHEFGCQI